MPRMLIRAPQTVRFLVALLLLALAAVSNVGAETPTSEGLQSVNGTELWVKRMGAGEPIVVVHGGPVLEHGYLLPHLAPLAEEYELIFFDQRLSGRSAPKVDESEVRMAAFVEDIEALRAELGLGRVHLMGHSWGGQLAMRYALEHEENLASLILLDPMAASAKLWKEEESVVGESVSEEIQAERQAILQSDELKARKPEAIEKLMRVSFAGQFHDPAKAEELHFFVPTDYAQRSGQFAVLVPELESYDLHWGLKTLSVPTLVLYGESEPGAELGGSAIVEALPGSELVLIPEAGHFPFIEQPDAFLEAVGSFLGRHRGAGAAVSEGAAPDELFERHWRLIDVGGEPVPAAEGAREPHLELDSEAGQVSGSDGCNRLSGSYELDGGRVTFGPIASTRMACPEGGVEMAFHAALAKAEAWRLDQQRLELLDGAGEVLARFEAGVLDESR